MQQDFRHTVKNVNPTQIAAKLFGCLDILHKHTHTHTHTHTFSATGVQYFKYTYSRALIYGFSWNEPREAEVFFIPMTAISYKVIIHHFNISIYKQLKTCSL